MCSTASSGGRADRKDSSHVLCEKPMVLTVEQANDVIAAARDNDVVVFEGFTHLFPGHIQHVEDLLAQGRIGEIRAIRSDVIYPTRDWENDTRARQPACAAGSANSADWSVSHDAH
jgi:predicted dehydrogenase